MPNHVFVKKKEKNMNSQKVEFIIPIQKINIVLHIFNGDVCIKATSTLKLIPSIFNKLSLKYIDI